MGQLRRMLLSQEGKMGRMQRSKMENGGGVIEGEKRWRRGEVEHENVEKTPGSRLIEALCGSRLRAVTPMRSPFAAFCSLCAEF